uniref:tail fiber domain-containing protein n=1 Tax=Eremococcus coleocola TaxID=88132 RepID=UPI0006876E90
NLYGFDYNGSRVLPGSKYGVWLSRGSGGFSINYMQDGGYVAGSDNVYYTVPQDGMGNTRIIEDIMRVSGGAYPFNTYEGAKAEISKLNGYGPWNNAATGWNVTLRKGDRVIYKQGTTSTYVPSGYQRFIDCTDSSNGTKTVYIYTEARLQQFTTFADGIWVKGKARVGSLQNDSDKRLKENIEATSVNALEEIKNLSFKSFDWKKSKEHEPIGLIAQDSGILRIKEDENHEFEAIDLSRALMLSLKAIQELEAKVKKLEVQNGK